MKGRKALAYIYFIMATVFTPLPARFLKFYGQVLLLLFQSFVYPNI